MHKHCREKVLGGFFSARVVFFYFLSAAKEREGDGGTSEVSQREREEREGNTLFE
jgi:hypothetical protein